MTTATVAKMGVFEVDYSADLILGSQASVTLKWPRLVCKGELPMMINVVNTGHGHNIGF